MGCRITEAQRELIDATLAAKPASYDDLARITGLSKWQVAHYMRGAHSASPRRVYIAAYGPDRNGRPFVRLFALGNAQDAPRPGRALSAAEQMRKSRAKKAAHGGK